ncbi:MAG: hypothetical protein ACREDG_06470, partial [Methylocella sp.]
GGAEKLSAIENVPVLGHVPIEISLMESGDRGVPFMLKSDPKSEAYQAILSVAKRIDHKFSGS